MFTRHAAAALFSLTCFAAFASAADVTPTNATATFEQGGFPISDTIDLDPTGSGWALHNGTSAVASTGVIEAATHMIVAPGNNTLTFNLNFGNVGIPNHELGKFQLYATSDQGALSSGATAGTAPGNWTLIHPTSVVSTGGSTLTINPDGSILASGPTPANESYTVTAPAPLVGITGVRIDALQDASLPASGPGRAFNGNMVMTDLAVASSARVALQNATATQSQGGFSVANTIDGVSDSTGWAFNSAASTGAFETATNVGFATGTKIQIGIDQRYGASHDLSNAKFYVTNADRSLFADGVDNSGNVGASGIWTEITPLRATSENHALVSIGTDNRVTFGGTNPATDTYTIQALSPISNITGMKIDIAGPPGRAENNNAVVSEVSFDAIQTQKIALTGATDTYDQGAPYVIANSINGDLTGPNQGWGVFGGQTSNQTAVFQTTTPVTAINSTFTLAFALGGQHNIQKFRISATSDPNPTVSSGATWTQLSPSLFFLDNSGAFSIDANNIITVTSPADVDRYTMMSHTPLSNVTGFRLEVFTGANGYIGWASNGNFVLNEFIVEVPEPSSVTLLALGGVFVWFGNCRRKNAEK